MLQVAPRRDDAWHNEQKNDDMLLVISRNGAIFPRSLTWITARGFKRWLRKTSRITTLC